jgi:hypothetical protein
MIGPAVSAVWGAKTSLHVLGADLSYVVVKFCELWGVQEMHDQKLTLIKGRRSAKVANSQESFCEVW